MSANNWHSELFSTEYLSKKVDLYFNNSITNRLKIKNKMCISFVKISLAIGG